MKAGALIPCRTGSKGIPGKNFKEFNGKLLTQWTVDAAQRSGIFSKIIVSSDGGAGDIVLRTGDVDVLDNERPEQFSTDDARLDPLLWYYAEYYTDIEMWCLLQPTSPLRTVKDIKASFRMIKGNKYDSIVSVTSDSGMLWINNAVGAHGRNHAISTYHVHKRPNRQERQDWYRENGAIYWMKRYVLEKMQCRLGGNVGLYVMPRERSLEIDEPLDWFIAETVGVQWAG